MGKILSNLHLVSSKRVIRQRAPDSFKLHWKTDDLLLCWGRLFYWMVWRLWVAFHLATVDRQVNPSPPWPVLLPRCLPFCLPIKIDPFCRPVHYLQIFIGVLWCGQGGGLRIPPNYAMKQTKSINYSWNQMLHICFVYSCFHYFPFNIEGT